MIMTSFCIITFLALHNYEHLRHTAATTNANYPTRQSDMYVMTEHVDSMNRKSKRNDER